MPAYNAYTKPGSRTDIGNKYVKAGNGVPGVNERTDMKGCNMGLIYSVSK